MGGRVSVDKPKVNLSLKSEIDGNKFDCCDEISCASSCCIFTISPNKQGSPPKGPDPGITGPSKEEKPVINPVVPTHDAVEEIARITDAHFVSDSSPKMSV